MMELAFFLVREALYLKVVWLSLLDLPILQAVVRQFQSYMAVMCFTSDV